MAEPKQRQTGSSGKVRRAHHRQIKIQLAICPKCKQLKLPHQVCPVCGTYEGKQIINVATTIKKTSKKAK